MSNVLHHLGDLASFALLLGALVGVLAWLASRAWASARAVSPTTGGVRASIASAVTVGLAVCILGARPGGPRAFPAEGDAVHWRWRWLGDLPDAVGADLLVDYTAAIALLNFALFSAWAFVVAWALGPGLARWAAVAAVMFPICLEALQRYPFGGTPSLTDAWTNILGGLVGVLSWTLVFRFSSARRALQAR